MSAYYNEFDPKAAAWLRELIKRGLIADGEVDGRSIIDVSPDDLRGFTQCHFFAGIGGWSYALRIAGWPDDRAVWTGSPPCQPFSAAGAGLGRDDARHLAPHFISLVRACRPRVLFGEQVASAAIFGKAASGARKTAASAPEWAWVDDLQDRLEAAHYAVGASDIPAAGVGGFHIRQRTFFGAIDGTIRRMGHAEDVRCGNGPENRRLGGAKCTKHCEAREGHGEAAGATSCAGGVANADGYRCNTAPECQQPAKERDAGLCGRVLRMGNAERTCAANGLWGTPDWLFCRDGKWRPVEPGTFPLAYGIPARVVRLRGYGNAIVPQAAAEFIEAFTEVIAGSV